MNSQVALCPHNSSDLDNKIKSRMEFPQMSRFEQGTGGELVGAKALLFTVVTKVVI